MIQQNRLQYISQGKDADSQLYSIQHALDAGCTWIQIRYKEPQDPQFMKLARNVKRLCEDYKAVCIINDYPEIAKEVDADGVHVGLADQKVEHVRRILGPNKIIGGTANTYAHILQRIDEKCDYVGVGPFRFTSTKEKLSPILGIEGYRKLIGELRKAQLSIPIYAIGGIEEKDLSQLRKENIHGVAVSGIITHTDKPKEMVQQLYKILNERI